jgi:tetratricopeptide (TPR) repeat protein
MNAENETDLRLAAESMLQQGRYSDAVVAYDKALQKAPGDPRLVLGKAYTHLAMTEEEEALAVVDRNVEANPKSGPALSSKAELLAAMNRNEDAVEWYRRAVEADSQNTEFWQGEAFALTRLGKYDDAVACYNTVLGFDSSRPDIWLEKGDALFDLERYSEALDCYRRAHQIVPLSAQDWTLMGDRFYESGQATEAIACYDQAIGIDSRHFGAWRGKGLAADLNGDVDLALKFLDSALHAAAKDERKLSTLVDKANLLAKHSDRLDDAIAAYDQALAINSRHYLACLGKAIVLENQRQYQPAVEVYDQAIALDATDNRAYEGKGRCLSEMGQLEAAVAAFDHALQIWPESFWASNDRAWALLQMRRYRDSIAEYDRAIRIDSTKSWPWANKGLALMEDGDYKTALAVLEEGLRRKVDDPIPVLLNVALFYSEFQIDNDRALDVYRDVLKLDPASTFNRLATAEVLVRVGRFEEGRMEAEGVTRNDTGMLRLLANYLIVASYLLEGDAARARDQFEKLAPCLLAKDRVTITEELWLFRGLTKQIQTSKVGLQDKFLLLTLLDLLTGKVNPAKLSFFEPEMPPKAMAEPGTQPRP